MSTPFTVQQRQEWMRLLAMAPTQELEIFWDNYQNKPEYQILRQPEVGLAMLKAQSCGNGQPFHFGEIPLSRSAVNIAGKVGHGYVQGRSTSHALHMAICDALLQDDASRETLEQTLLAPIIQGLNNREKQREAALLKTKVDFFTMVRGEDDQ